jgi:2-polyprenyl-3-methyl-5-hydroxy-6-metoxy-1,4-benzoquinol methylase
MISPQLLEVLACTKCLQSLTPEQDNLVCTNCQQKYPVKDDIPMLIEEIRDTEEQFTQQKFNKIYQQEYDAERVEKYIKYLQTEHIFYNQHILENLPNTTHGRFIEIGCGGGLSGVIMSRKGYSIYGIDYSMPALKLSQKINQAFGITAHLVYGDILEMPFKPNSFDIIYGGGTIEHVEDTQKVVNSLYTSTKPAGFCINTVPVISISSLTYRQLSANIPDLPILKQIYHFIHKTVLRGKFMHTGYEKSFLKKTLYKYHQKAGFKSIKITKYEFVPELPHFQKWIKPLLRKLEKNRLFWTAITVNAEK